MLKDKGGISVNNLIGIRGAGDQPLGFPFYLFVEIFYTMMNVNQHYLGKE